MANAVGQTSLIMDISQKVFISQIPAEGLQASI
jgi:hypothetical protein